MSLLEAFVVGAGEGERIHGPAGGPSSIKANTDSTGGSFTAIENVIGPGQGPPRHIHRREDEIWYVIDGHFRFLAGERLLDAPQGSLVFVPRGTPHCFQNLANHDSRILVMFTPSGMERFFEDFARIRPTTIEEYKEIAERSWMEVAGPPLAESHPLGH